MRKKWKYGILPVLLLFFLVFSCGTALGIDLEELKERQKEIQSRLNDVKNNINKVETKKKNVVQELTAIEKELDRAQKDLEAVAAKLVQTQKMLEQTKQDLKNAENALQNQKQSLASRLVAMYKAGPVDYIEVILSASSFSDFLTRLDMVRRIVDYDKDLLDNYKAIREEVNQKKALLEKQQYEISKQQNTIKEKKIQIASRQAERKKLLAELEKEKQQYLREEEELERDSKQIAAMIQRIQSQNKRKFVGTGVFQWPVPSSQEVTSDYGWRVHPIFKVKKFHTGLDIAAPYGADVVAADDGVVIYTGWYGGYGNTVIIDHGGSISTLYAHLSKINVQEGDKVKKGSKIADVGSTGFSTGPHLHFEVRKEGQHVNPWDWLR
ncbi:murein hydrolase activator EnvC family protein [Thermovenabulum sp.]|uniref:murein hydrolase activator EnvC family protein n=1 Tax=Thermovenabulum sp. TaxID=3100335 RepID=UPI003C7DB010